MLQRRIYFSRSRRLLAVLLLLVATSGGCARFNPAALDLNRLRDERAVDIDHRLDQNQPIVDNPF